VTAKNEVDPRPIPPERSTARRTSRGQQDHQGRVPATPEHRHTRADEPDNRPPLQTKSSMDEHVTAEEPLDVKIGDTGRIRVELALQRDEEARATYKYRITDELAGIDHKGTDLHLGPRLPADNTVKNVGKAVLGGFERRCIDITILGGYDEGPHTCTNVLVENRDLGSVGWGGTSAFTSVAGLRVSTASAHWERRGLPTAISTTSLSATAVTTRAST
jgi:hypothetical protein